jgi:lysophospholipase L1-like esterase
MAQFAREIGVPESRLLLETASRSTRENAERSAPLLRRLGVRRLLLVTDRLHMRRAQGAFSAFGFDVERASVPVYRSYDSNTSMLRAGIVELAALVYYQARGWMDSGDRATTGGDDVHSQTTVVRGEAGNPSGPLVILGASYARGWALANVAGFAVINRGVDGDRSLQMLERLERDLPVETPRAVILWGYINDFFRAAPDKLDEAARRVPDNYRRMVEMLRQRGVEPIVATEVTIRPPDTWRETLSSWLVALRGRETYQDRINRHVLATNRSLVELARNEGVLLLDFQTALGGNGGIRRRAFTQADGSHITEDGYATLTAYVTPVLERHLAGKRP